MVTTFTITISPIYKGSTSQPAANAQGLKIESSVSTAVPRQAYKSEELTSGDVKPHSASKREGDLQSSKHDRGESVDLR